MKKMRFLSALLAALMILSSLCACGDAGTPGTTPETQASTAGQTEASQETETEVTDDLPDDLNYGNDEVVILSRYREGWTSGEIAVEKTTGEVVNDAVYTRNKMVEERLQVKIVSLEEPGDSAYIVIDKVANAVQAGTHEYDILAAACYVTVNQSLNGIFMDLRQSEYIDFSKPYWSQGYNQVVEYHGAQFAGLSSALISQYRFPFVTIFNKDIFDDYKQPYLYDYVDNYTWTLDKQISLVPIFHTDNGNHVQDEQGDVYGLVTNDYVCTDPYWSSCKVDILKKDENGDYTFVFDSGKLHNVAEKLMKLFYDTDDGTYDYKMETDNAEQARIRTMFSEGNAAMATLRILELEAYDMRNMKQEFGVVPMPMYDQAQKEYRTLLHDQFTVFSIPNTIQSNRFEEMCAVLEAMASISYQTVRPAYYETNLRTKIAKDPQSAKMFDIIIDNIYIDAGIVYTKALDYFQNPFRELMGTKENTVVSRYKRMRDKTQKAVAEINSKLDKAIKK